MKHVFTALLVALTATSCASPKPEHVAEETKPAYVSFSSRADAANDCYHGASRILGYFADVDVANCGVFFEGRPVPLEPADPYHARYLQAQIDAQACARNAIAGRRPFIIGHIRPAGASDRCDLVTGRADGVLIHLFADSPPGQTQANIERCSTLRFSDASFFEAADCEADQFMQRDFDRLFVELYEAPPSVREVLAGLIDNFPSPGGRNRFDPPRRPIELQ